MRRALIIAGGFIGLIILILAGLLGYAVLNLNSLIQLRRDYLLSRVSDAIGRPVTVATIRASLGWGVLIDLSGVRIAGDPAFSALPLVEARDLYLKVEFLPLLFHEIRITELRLTHPIVRVIRNQAGELNLAALARQRATRAVLSNPNGIRPPNGSGTAPNANPPSLAQPAANRPFGEVSIHRFTLTDGVVDYLDQSAPKHAPVELQNVQVTVDNFSFGARFGVDLSFAALGTEKNFDLSGTVGPLITDGALDLNAIPLSLKAELGPLTFSQLQALPRFAPPLTITGPLNATATADGTVDGINFTVNSDLSANQIIWQPSFIKPSGTTMTVAANGTRGPNRVTLSSIDLVLASLKAHLTQVHLESGHLAAHLATNDFTIAPIAPMIPAAAKYHPSGTAKLDTAMKLAAGHPPILDGAVALSAVALAIPEARGGAAPITQLSGPIRFDGNAAHIGPLTFHLGSAHARLSADAQSLQPPRLSYQFSADQLVLADLIPSRQQFAPEYLSNLTANGTASIPRAPSEKPSGKPSMTGTPAGTLNLAATEGLIQNVPFTSLALAAAYASDRVTLNSLAFNSCDGGISGSGAATLGMEPGFDLTLATQGLDLQKALTAVKARAANTVRGLLTANLSISGHGQDFARIRPTLRGDGNAHVINAKLVGVNVAAQALRKIDHLPAIGSLVPQSVVNNHPELFASPDTDIQSASLTFVIFGQRLTTHDFAAQALDYSAAADGWFDLGKDLDMNVRIILARPFSSDLIAARKNVAFLADRGGQIVIPLRITGRLPHPNVMPNIDILAQRAASNAMQNKLGGLLDKGGKGLGGIFKHGNPLQGLFR